MKMFEIPDIKGTYKKQIGIIGSRNLSKENIEFISELSELLVINLEQSRWFGCFTRSSP